MPTGTNRPNRTLSGDESLVLPEFDAPPDDPVTLLQSWLKAADVHGVREAATFALATADAQGRTSSRIVLLKEITDGGLVFSSHVNSRKGRELAAVPWASATFYWRETLQQVNVAGPVAPLPEHRSDALYAERTVAAQATTAVSRQSTPLTDEAALHHRAQELIERGEPLDRPAGWGGYALRPERIEFWQGKASRLHRRLEYTHDGARWSHQRLQP